MTDLQEYTDNIVRQAKKCGNITCIVQITSFPEFCEAEQPLIAIAILGKKKRTPYLRSKEFKEFHRQLFACGGEYDILYFGKNDAVPEHIRNGEVIYVR